MQWVLAVFLTVRQVLGSCVQPYRSSRRWTLASLQRISLSPFTMEPGSHPCRSLMGVTILTAVQTPATIPTEELCVKRSLSAATNIKFISPPKIDSDTTICKSGIWVCKKNLNIEKITFKVVQMKFLAMHITNQKLSIDIFTVGIYKISSWKHDLYLIS